MGRRGWYVVVAVAGRQKRGRWWGRGCVAVGAGAKSKYNHKDPRWGWWWVGVAGQAGGRCVGCVWQVAGRVVCVVGWWWKVGEGGSGGSGVVVGRTQK